MRLQLGSNQTKDLNTQTTETNLSAQDHQRCVNEARLDHSTLPDTISGCYRAGVGAGVGGGGPACWLGAPRNRSSCEWEKTQDTPKETLSLKPSKRREAQSNEWMVEHKMPTLKTFPKAPSPSSPMISQISSGFSSLRTCSYCFFFFSAPNLNILRKLKNDIVVYSAGKFLKEFNFNRSNGSASVFG